MPMNGPLLNNSGGGGGGGVSPPWNQVVAAATPPSSAVTVAAANSVPAGERREGFDDAGNNGGGAGGKKHAWNKPSANGGGGGGGGSSSTEEVKPVMDDADSWPALLDSARATAKSPSLSEPTSVKASTPEFQGTGSGSGSAVPPPQRQVRDNVGMNNAAPTHQRTSYKRGNSNVSSNGGYSPHLSGPQGSMAASGSLNHGTRSGFVPNDYHTQRNSFRNRNGGPHPRGDGAHHHTYGGRRDQGHGNQEWNNHRNFNGRENYMSPRFAPRFIRPSPTPPPPHPSPTPQMYAPPPPPAMRPFSHIGYPDLHPPMIYVPPPLDSLRGYPFPPSITPSIVFFHPPDPHLHIKIVNQIDYYFSNDNLIKDLYLRQHMDDQGWVPVSLIAGFNKVQQLTEDIQIVLEALRTSSVVEVQGDKIRRRNDWGRWVIPRGQLPNLSSSQTVVQLAERVQGITLEATNKDGARIELNNQDVSQNRELNNQLLLPTNESTGQL